jgi:hypothetical protein
MEYKDERSADLRLHLFEGPVDLEAFPVLVRRSRTLARVEVDACIIGASHAVQFRAGAQTLTEVLACRTRAVDRFQHRLSGIWRLEEDVCAHGYTFTSELAPLAGAQASLAVLRDSIRRAESNGAIGLAFRFPSTGAEPPETLLHVSAEVGRITVRSAHVYPQDGVAVLSRTLLNAGVPRWPARELVEAGAS